MINQLPVYHSPSWKVRSGQLTDVAGKVLHQESSVYLNLTASRKALSAFISSVAQIGEGKANLLRDELLIPKD